MCIRDRHDLSIRCFADRLYDLNHLVFLYPNRLKDEVFGPYYSPQRTDVRGDGYVDSVVKIFMPGSHTRNTMSNPASPAPSLYSFTAGTPNPRSPFPTMSPYNGSIIPEMDLPDLGLIDDFGPMFDTLQPPPT